MALATNEANWATDENKNERHKQAIKLAAERERLEKKWIKDGKKQILIPHPTSPKCFIVKFV
jgi:hypothetical protein